MGTKDEKTNKTNIYQGGHSLFLEQPDPLGQYRKSLEKGKEMGRDTQSMVVGRDWDTQSFFTNNRDWDTQSPVVGRDLDTQSMVTSRDWDTQSEGPWSPQHSSSPTDVMPRLDLSLPPPGFPSHPPLPSQSFPSLSSLALTLPPVSPPPSSRPFHNIPTREGFTYPAGLQPRETRQPLDQEATVRIYQRQPRRDELPPCRFCLANEPNNPLVFLGHATRTSSGAVACPFLRSYTCETCGATGDTAHTSSYCPGREGRSSVTRALKMTRRLSDGRRRKTGGH